MRQLVASLTLIVTSASLNAQAIDTKVTVTISPTYIHFENFGGGFGTVARVGVSRDFSGAIGGEASAFALGTFGGATAQPGCLPGAACVTLSTPRVFSGILAALYAKTGHSGLRVTGGVGGVIASGGEGFQHRTGAAGFAGLDWIPLSKNRLGPMLTIRFVQLTRTVGFTRFLLLPGAGVSF